ncbi:flagellar biosynthesis anti-sigma factor FlgM [Clostridium botulinum C]|uniref:Negative regulator of flagellin synthesis n=5 Tax=Clostridium TaxID=1485 RepID=A0A9Q4TDQ6_CLOBO|nr:MULTISPECIES: flagellar biosynthesis anti-sigma factor FlgM [Clostridium]KEI10689.1 flagellar biosynthesis anti-sigma factor FlgM [Clostridium sp. K25]KEI13069.1 flagellar biosynthesis anti-sigma factor FlgM [Clostridium novyi B str. NCTC 9691]KEI15820.1 flagellar biosynthesis anti-sigma factor FlgM [Clostridium novyi B str. ATCC 27606]KEI16210.1 flagellar biosynthesis anti-sigma factor FlgM [Clostridium haemolyticum NCTC 9693]KGN03777.1 flagellar biosynthesis anti-sigma factor FlgM [Clostr
MKITGTSMNKVISIYEVNNKKMQKSEKVSLKDTIEVSKLGRELSSFDNEEVTSISSKRIEEIKSQIAKGTYNVDSKLIAKKMLENMKNQK